MQINKIKDIEKSNFFGFNDLKHNHIVPFNKSKSRGIREDKKELACQIDDRFFYSILINEITKDKYYINVLRPQKHIEYNLGNEELYLDVKQSLEQLKLFKSNWDGFGARKFDQSVLTNTHKVLKQIFKGEIPAQKIEDVHLEPGVNGVIVFRIFFKKSRIKNSVIGIGDTSISSYSKYLTNQSGLRFFSKIKEYNHLLHKISNSINGFFEYSYINENDEYNE